MTEQTVDYEKEEHAWDKSYSRGDNNILYPKDEVLRFMSKYIIKRTHSLYGGMQNTVLNIKSPDDFPLDIKGLDFGCGIGRNVIYMGELGIKGYGIDVSSTAIALANSFSSSFVQKDLIEADNVNFLKMNPGEEIPFRNSYFDFSVCDGVLDSMSHEMTKQCFGEIFRVTDRYIYFSVIGSESHTSGNFVGEEVVTTPQHEENTIQNYFDIDKINDLLSPYRQNIMELHIQKETKEYAKQEVETVVSGFNPNKHSRFHVTIEKY